MSSNPKSNFYQAAEEHETLSIETLESGELRIKFYSYKKSINPINFAAKLQVIEKELNAKDYYIEGRSNKNVTKPVKVSGEVTEKSTSDKPLMTVKGDDFDAVVTKYIDKRKELAGVS